MNAILVINPRAGNSDKVNFVDEAKKFAKDQKINLTVYWTNGKTDEEGIMELVEAEKPDRIIAAGGDGTIQMTAQLLQDKKISFGIVPMGTSNGLATDLKIPSNPIEAFKNNLNSKHTIDLDFICANGSDYFIHIGDVGANAQLIRRFEKAPQQNYASYAMHLIEELQEMKSFDYQISCNDEERKGSARMIAFCNARKFGSGIPLTLTGHPGDGKFEIVIYKEITFNTIMKSTLSGLDEHFFNPERQEIITTTSAKIQLDTEVLMQLDGELKGKTKSIELEIKPAQLELICSEECPYNAPS